MAVGRLPRKVGGSVMGLAALGALAGVEPAGAATATATYQRNDEFVMECQAGQACDPGTSTCSIRGQVTTYDDGTITGGVTILTNSGASNCDDGRIRFEVTYDPDPSDAATSTFRLTADQTGHLGFTHVPAPNFIEAQYVVRWIFDVDDPGHTAGPYRLPK
jgi:hypothetical protein